MKPSFNSKNRPITPFFLLLALTPATAQAQRAPNLARSLTAALGAQGRLMWIDGTANLFRMVKRNGKSVEEPWSTTREGVADIVAKCKRAHVNTLVVDIKPLSGEVLYASKIAPHMTTWQGKPIPDFDVLKAFVEEGHRAGLQVYAASNTLAEGHKYYSVGPAYAHPQWQSMVYGVDRKVRTPDGSRLSFRVPNEPDDAQKPTLLTDSDSVLSAAPNSRIGLDTVEGKKNLQTGERSPLDQRLHVLMSSENRVEGFIDNALLGDDPLLASENGRMLTVTEGGDRESIRAHFVPGAKIEFEVKGTRTPIAKAPAERVACFVSLTNPEARAYELSIVKEVMQNYDVDGYCLDRCRYSNLYNDFSDAARTAFERWLGKPIARFPEDIFSFSRNPGSGLVHGALFKKWLEFRATMIRDFVADIARTVRTAKPGAKLGTYVGAWYPSYFEVGVNWGSPNTRLRYSWQTETYPETGYAEYFDWVTTGCYHPTPTKREARRKGQSEQASVEFLAQTSQNAVANAAFVYPGINVPDYRNRPDAMIRALETAAQQGQGWMIFDITYIEEFGMWDTLEKGFPQDAVSPETIPGLLEQVRSARDSIEEGR